MLSWLVGIKDARLIGSALAVTTFSALTGILAYAQTGSIDIGKTVAIAFGFLIGAALGQRAGADKPRASRRGRGIGVVVGGAISALMLAEGFGHLHVRPLAFEFFRHSGLGYLAALILGIGTGFFGRLLDLAGLLIVPALYFVAGSSMLAAQGCAVTILVLNSLPAAIAYARNGVSDARSSVWVSFGALFGALAGSQSAGRNHYDPQMLVVYGVVMLVMIGIRLLSTPMNTTEAKSTDESA
jgi:uncharacterized membrane protein YfcA